MNSRKVKKEQKSDLLKQFVESLNVTPTKDLPKDVFVILAMMEDINIDRTDSQVVFALLDFVQKRVAGTLENARIYANHARKKFLDLDDVRLANDFDNDQSFILQPSHEILSEMSAKINAVPLPVPKTCFGLRIPSDRYCLTNSVNRMKSSAVLQLLDTAGTNFESMIIEEDPNSSNLL